MSERDGSQSDQTAHSSDGMEHTSLVGRGANLSGENCPRCGYTTHKASFDGETWYRCVTDSCPRGWYEATPTEQEGSQ